jgi:hypothetical protein
VAEGSGEQGRDVLGLVVGDLEAIGPPVAGHRLLGRELCLVGDAIRWIRPDQVRLGRFPEHSAHVGWIGGVTAQEAMISQGVEVAPADRRLVWDVRRVIGID